MIPCGPLERFQLTAAMVRAHWSERTAGVLLASPSNPTGTSIPTGELRAIADASRERGGFTLVDEIYQGLSYDAKPESALALGEDLIVINSFSKYFNMTGWRLGWLVVPPTMLPAIEKLAQNMFICASSIAQQAALACFTPEATAIFESRKEEFRRRRDYLVPALQQLGFEIPVIPDGAFYIYADCTAFTHDTDAFARELLDHTGVVLVPGLDFGDYAARRYLRVSYATSMENLAEAVERLGKYLAERQPDS
jgi:aspartate/methionine/tyrosine aminotransferase